MTIDDLIPKQEAFKLVAKTLNLSYAHVRDTVSKSYDFPKPRRQFRRSAVYAKADIYKWLGVK